MVENIVSKKYKFTKKFKYSYWNGDIDIIPKGIIVSIVSIHMTRLRRKVILQVIRNKKIVENFYKDIAEEEYRVQSSWNKDGFIMHELTNEDADEFLKLIIDPSYIIDFTSEYERIITYYEKPAIPIIPEYIGTHYVSEGEFIRFIEVNSMNRYDFDIYDKCKREIFSDEGKTYYPGRISYDENNTEFAVLWVNKFFDAHPFIKNVMFVFDD